MKKWMPERDVLPSLPMPLPAVDPAFFGCVDCAGQAGVLFEGTSYCRSCLTEKLRRGR